MSRREICSKLRALGFLYDRYDDELRVYTSLLYPNDVEITVSIEKRGDDIFYATDRGRTIENIKKRTLNEVLPDDFELRAREVCVAIGVMFTHGRIVGMIYDSVGQVIRKVAEAAYQVSRL